MNKKTGIVLGIIVILAIILGVWYFMEKDTGPVPDNALYRNADFSFTYPRGYELEEYASGAVSLGQQEGDMFNPAVDIIRYKSDPDVAAPANFESFIRRQAQNLCGADGSTESITCTGAVSVPFHSPSGYDGFAINMSLVRKNLTTGTTSTTAYPPVYAFNLTDAPSGGEPVRYAALLIYPSLPAVVASGTTTEPGLMDQILHSISIVTPSIVGQSGK